PSYRGERHGEKTKNQARKRRRQAPLKLRGEPPPGTLISSRAGGTDCARHFPEPQLAGRPVEHVSLCNEMFESQRNRGVLEVNAGIRVGVARAMEFTIL